MSVTSLANPNSHHSHRREVHAVTRKYLTGEVSASSALRSLKRSGRLGNLMRGEISLQEAAVNPDDKSRWLQLAEQSYRHAASGIGFDKLTPETPNAIRALVRLAQLPVLRVVLESGSLPDKSARGMVETAYVKTVWAGTRLADMATEPNWPHENKSKTRTKQEARGVCSEIGVLALADRVAIREQIFDCWLPTQSLLADDRGNYELGTLDHNNWDVSILSQVNQEPIDLSEPAHKVQVKSSRRPPKYGAAYGPDIHIVSLNPDLQLPGVREINLGRHILRECWQEMANPQNTYTTDNLDVRTEQFLSILDPR